MTETNRIEYKRELSLELDIEKEVVAFLNYKDGGYNYIGIDKDGSTVGFSDVELVESLGSGIPRILRAYGEDCFKFTDNFIRITLPISAHDHASDHASVQVEKLVSILTGEMGRSDLQRLLSIKNRDHFRTDYLNPAISNDYVELTIPDKPNSRNQKYRLTAKGIALKDALKNNDSKFRRR